MREIINFFWHGSSELSTMECLSLESFLHHGYRCHLYTYQLMGCTVPEGVTVKEASSILPVDRIIDYSRKMNVYNAAPFSDAFRYMLIYLKGGWWSDLDVIMLKPFDFKYDCVYGYQDEATINGAICSAPKHALFLRLAFDFCERVERLEWGDIGPHLLTKIFGESNGLYYIESEDRLLPRHALLLPVDAFYPVPWQKARKLVEADFDMDILKNSYCVHLWHKMWSEYKLDKDGLFPSTSLYERLKARYL